MTLLGLPAESPQWSLGLGKATLDQRVPRTLKSEAFRSRTRFLVLGLGFGVSGLGFRIWGLGFGV